ncbi:unnamed protein product [Pieris macdunnoughi]|uniref:Uncharacterized protein n=1 Tax=Pieris macdunnoughi TaxID=345717 RepID=A0A821WVZ9_9NEOP|nr:unnamed protein product [Pieris macdunnoughi]
MVTSVCQLRRELDFPISSMWGKGRQPLLTSDHFHPIARTSVTTKVAGLVWGGHDYNFTWRVQSSACLGMWLGSDLLFEGRISTCDESLVVDWRFPAAFLQYSLEIFSG